MFRNYIVTALRNLARNKVNTTINVLGLTLGITCSLVLFLVIKYELSFNKHFADQDQVYRIVTQSLGDDGRTNLSSSMQMPFVRIFQSDFEDIPVTFVENNFNTPNIFVEKDGDWVRFPASDGHVAMVHPDYPQIFSHDWLFGDPNTALTDINSLVITRKMAMTYFNRLDVVGETVRYNEEATLKITGVIEDYPQTTDFPLDLIISIETHGQYREEAVENWGGNYSGLHCFVKLPEGMTAAAFEARMEGFDAKHRGEKYAENYHRLLQPLGEMHYATEMSAFSVGTISKLNLLAVGLIGALLLFAACMNFVNLNTALALKRAKEVGVRKVLGGSRMQLFKQFMGETFLISFFAMIISFGGVELALIQLKKHIGYDLDFTVLSDMGMMLFMLMVLLFSVLFSGLYPALIMSSFKPVAALKNRVGQGNGKGVSLRKVLVTIQMAISQALIICTILVVKQMDHFYNSPLGLEPESVVEVFVGSTNAEDNQLFRSLASETPGIEMVTFSNTGAISNSLWAGNYSSRVAEEEMTGNAHVKFIDDYFLDTYGIQLIAGENVRDSEKGDEYLVNEVFLADLGIKDPVEALGLPVSIWGNDGFIKGVVANYNSQSLHESLKPLVMLYQEGYASSAIRFETSEVQTMIKGLESAFVKAYPGKEFNANFLDETINNFYSEEQKASLLFQVAAGVAIFIGCIGMFGLVSYIAGRKTKEVGVRKVLGASVANILAIFSRHFLSLAFLGFVVAAPISYYLMDGWLQNYQYRIDIGAGTFALGLVATLVLVAVSTGLRAYRSATVNPVKSLRSE